MEEAMDLLWRPETIRTRSREHPIPWHNYSARERKRTHWHLVCLFVCNEHDLVSRHWLSNSTGFLKYREKTDCLSSFNILWVMLIYSRLVIHTGSWVDNGMLINIMQMLFEAYQLNFILIYSKTNRDAFLSLESEESFAFLSWGSGVCYFVVQDVLCF